MTKNHLKSISAPKTWDISRKERVYIVRPTPGQSSMYLGMPLVVILRDILSIAKKMKEVQYLINNKEILVNGKEVADRAMIVGFMDVITLPKIKKQFRVVMSKKQTIEIIEIPQKESTQKICQIIGKTSFKGKTQINLYDGRNLIIDKDNYKVGDSVMISLPKIKITEHFPLEKGATIILIGGKHVGERGHVEHLDQKTLTYKRESKEVYETDKKYAFVIGKSKAALTL